MPSPERTFGVISKHGSPQFKGTEEEILAALVYWLPIYRFRKNVAERGTKGRSIGVVPASAPTKKAEE